MPVTVRRDDYFAGALRLLADEGASGLTVHRLCRSIGVTTGSFYHHFEGLDGFVGEFLEHWEREQTTAHALLAEAARGPADAIAVLKASALGLPHPAEAAIRVWSHRDQQVASAQARVDERRLEALRGVIGRVVADTDTIDLLAVFGLRLLIGFQQGGDPGRQAELVRLMDEYERMVLTHADHAAVGS